ncbi:unnamed protein product [Caenorhabditis bovis]|uniref:Alpha-ketoglutarate-dependent dioxygenase AlkB-like domain-containing protein n=1 Tax=Caenorhabditis bovis TaxID=2654633 RepID=A0A8S1F395_9PELO|nr:unnamed protein product [Caenorhabditis bovis]
MSPPLPLPRYHHYLIDFLVLQKPPRCEADRYVGSMILEPRSLFIMTDRAYETMLHGIAERDSDYIDPAKVFNCRPELENKTIQRGTRISITIRNVAKVSKLNVFEMLKK